jgi:hypothetical protein
MESCVGVITTEVERFERLCSEERSFGIEIEKTIQKIDEIAQKDLAYAEAELEQYQLECVALKERLQKAREGEYPDYHI